MRNESYCDLFKMNWSYLLLISLLSRGYAQTDEIETTDLPTTTAIPILYLSDITTELTWSPKSHDSIKIKTDEGYKISVNITDCNIDGENGEYATITTDESANGLIFSYSINSQPAYLYNSIELLGDFFGTNASNFTAVFTRIGESVITTTTELPTTTIFLPTPAPNDSDTLVVYIAGRAAHEYENEILDLLIDTITRMAVDYCENENFPLNGTISSKNVQIRRLTACPMSWPKYETCAQVTFAVPVNLRNDSNSIWGGYQMTTAHLEIMWSRYSSYLPDGITVYFEPDMGQLKWGIVIATGIVAVFVISLFIIRYYGIKVSKMMRRRKSSDVASIISESERNSQISLPPHYLQETPPLFENAYPMYNPEKSPTYAEPSYAKSFDYSDYQDLNTEMKENPDDNDIEESGA